jgi:hypothetical protein
MGLKPQAYLRPLKKQINKSLKLAPYLSRFGRLGGALPR